MCVDFLLLTCLYHLLLQVSPIEYGHVLLVPRLLDRLPQRIQADTLLLALHMAVEVDNPYLRLGYNSLGAFATINHLHFQVIAIFCRLNRSRKVNVVVLNTCTNLCCRLIT